MVRRLALCLLLTACGSAAQDAAAARESELALARATIDGRPGPPKRTPDRLHAIPDSFRGRWASAGDCGEGAPDVLSIARDSLGQGGRTARPSFILRAGAQELSMELAGAGEPWPATLTLTLLPDGRLNRAEPDGTQLLHTRCPAA